MTLYVFYQELLHKLPLPIPQTNPTTIGTTGSPETDQGLTAIVVPVVVVVVVMALLLMAVVIIIIVCNKCT